MRTTPRMPFRPPSSSWRRKPARSAIRTCWATGSMGSLAGRRRRPKPGVRAGGCVRKGRRHMSSIAVVNGPAELESVQREETAMLHEEVDRLPQSLRTPIVLCYLEGLTHGEAARRLRWPIGTVRSRMARARGLLRARLTRRGLAYAAIVAAIESPRAVHGGSAACPGRHDGPVGDRARNRHGVRVRLDPGCHSDEGGAQGHVHQPAQTDRRRPRSPPSAIATGAGIIAMGALQPRPSSAQSAQAAQAADQRAVEGNRAGPTTAGP